MPAPPVPAAGVHEDHISWVRTRMTLDAELMEWIRHGFGLITVGFGSFAFLDGILGGLGEHAGRSTTDPSRIFSILATAIGILVILIALRHNRMMVEFVNQDEFEGSPALALPNEKREEYLAIGAMILGAVSFVALLILP
ncbi:MAG: DUF202 domain-containing protein [Thermomicrobiales bacterium]